MLKLPYVRLVYKCSHFGALVVAQSSAIEWTDATWNPVTGCTKISPGCKHCYAERMAKRLHAMEQPRYRNAFRLTLQPDIIDAPLRWKKPRRVFVNSMSDLFHRDVPCEYIVQCFSVMSQASRHSFQVLTKRPERALQLADRLKWPTNVWLGTSSESSDYLWRVDVLRKVPAAIRFVSLEPLLSHIPNIDLSGIHWVIVGGESGPGARPMKAEWVLSLRDICKRENVAFFFKSGVVCRKLGPVGCWRVELGTKCPMRLN